MDLTLIRKPNLDDRNTVVFVIEHPADIHEIRFTVILSRASWESQGSPETMTVRMTAVAA